MEEVLNIGGLVFLLLLAGALLVLVVISFLRDFLAPMKTKEAVVIEKKYIRPSSNGRFLPQGSGTYILDLLAEGKHLSFFVSVWVYDSFSEGEKCTIRYKGSQLISIE